MVNVMLFNITKQLQTTINKKTQNGTSLALGSTKVKAYLDKWAKSLGDQAHFYKC